MKSLRQTFVKVLLIFAFLVAFQAVVDAQKIRVITTVSDLADMTKQIGKDLVDVESLTRGVEFMHAVPVKPSFVPKLNRADVLVAIGLDLEVSWLPALLEVANNTKILPGQPGHIDTSVGVTVAEAPRTFDRSEGDVHPKGNPHYNLDPVNGRIMARNIAEGLSRNFPQHKATFDKNLNAYLAELNKAIVQWEGMAAPLKGVKIVPYHQDWTYFANRFGSTNHRQYRAQTGHRADAQSFACADSAHEGGEGSGHHLRSAKRPLPAPARGPNGRCGGALAANFGRLARDRYLHQVH